MVFQEVWEPLFVVNHILWCRASERSNNVLPTDCIVVWPTAKTWDCSFIDGFSVEKKFISDDRFDEL